MQVHLERKKEERERRERDSPSEAKARQHTRRRTATTFPTIFGFTIVQWSTDGVKISSIYSVIYTYIRQRHPIIFCLKRY